MTQGTPMKDDEGIRRLTRGSREHRCGIALDTTSPLPLFNSLTQLIYLTSTSPRIREIMTMDGGLERLSTHLSYPPPPENPAMLNAPTARSNKLVPTLNPPSFDKHAAYRFSLAFQCLFGYWGMFRLIICIRYGHINGYVREYDPYWLYDTHNDRSRPRDGKEWHSHWKEGMGRCASPTGSSPYCNASTHDPSLVEHLRAPPTPSSDTSRPETETEDDGDAEGDLDADRDGDISMDRRRMRQAIVPSASTSPERRPSVSITRPTRRTVGIVSDDPPATSIIITDAGGSVDVVAVGGDGGVEEGIVSLDQNDDFAMGAPPGAPGAIDDGAGGRRVDLDLGLGALERRLSIPGVNGPDIITPPR
ncbi:hypothetical protein PC9H_009191 [Pleurotus ostreatus]|uniref:Uncharacterized protein n=1 Tax=Pleurotus ostreatus TaxID=5322 RepID=A0A8H6ZT83_PLEOS|nr:uncharacterized protein PC9H_009191 [Pleurotus ostreatus]KAF7426822.1 hypothetical protein PC9H_009191 [Pleurotus ostreatus]KAJ8694434.1 hypothetical protein PTI98_009358 [Pleurotus ostreatus]